MKGRERGNVNAVKEGAVVEKVFFFLSPLCLYTSLFAFGFGDGRS